MREWFERVAYWAVWSGLEAGRLAAKLVPRRLLVSLSEALAEMAFYLCHGFRTRSIKNLGLALGDRLTAAETAAIVRGSLRNFFRGVIEIGYALCAPPEELRREIRVVGREHLDAAVAGGRGTIIFSAHLGNFFCWARGLPSRAILPMFLSIRRRAGPLGKFLTVTG
jgi:KDO2-lipid IV(A) lauroyltransferase